MGFEHSVESMQEFAHDGDQGLHFEFAFGDPKGGVGQIDLVPAGLPRHFLLGGPL
jgi:hypothetical protein